MAQIQFKSKSFVQNHSMLEKYPVIIEEVIKKTQSDELRCFNLSSFMSDKPLEEVFQEIDKDMKFFSVCIFTENISSLSMNEWSH